jgi:hypothetical protein
MARNLDIQRQFDAYHLALTGRPMYTKHANKLYTFLMGVFIGGLTVFLFVQ